jgi:hypothetical protein
MHSVSTISDNTSSKRILQGPFLVDADLRCRFGLSTMVSNALGCLRCCTVHSLGRCCGTLPVSRVFVCQRTVANLSFRGTCLWLWLGVLDAVQGVGLYVYSQPGIRFKSNLSAIQGYDSASDFIPIACVRHTGDCANAGFGCRHHRQGHRSEQSKCFNLRYSEYSLTPESLQNGPGGVFPDAALWDIAGGDGSMNPLGVSSALLSLCLVLY